MRYKHLSSKVLCLMTFTKSIVQEKAAFVKIYVLEKDSLVSPQKTNYSLNEGRSTG